MTLALNLLDVLLIVVSWRTWSPVPAGVLSGLFAAVLGLVLGTVLAFSAGPVVAWCGSTAVADPRRAAHGAGAAGARGVPGRRAGPDAGGCWRNPSWGWTSWGAVLNVAVAALVISLLSSLVGQFGLPGLYSRWRPRRCCGHQRLTPDAVRHAMTQPATR
ncbi:hypothetical protein QJS66_18580 [Kocuria rhizophila]|nr:hypothetical protein QJS66_18580 [Kocuria rhizophila]